MNLWILTNGLIPKFMKSRSFENKNDANFFWPSKPKLAIFDYHGVSRLTVSVILSSMVAQARGTFFEPPKKVPKKRRPEDSLILRFSAFAPRLPDSTSLCWQARSDIHVAPLRASSQSLRCSGSPHGIKRQKTTKDLTLGSYL